MEDERIKFAKKIDFSRVDTSDRNYNRNIVLGILQFENPMPDLVVDIHSTPDHYNISVKNWSQEISIAKLYETFESKNRATIYDSVISVSLVPQNDEGVPVLLFRIRKSSFAKQKKK